jgi:hypothetical protein
MIEDSNAIALVAMFPSADQDAPFANLNASGDANHFDNTLSLNAGRSNRIVPFVCV